MLDALDDEVSEIREETVEELETVVDSLKNISSCHDWGMFRYLTSKAVLEHLKTSQNIMSKKLDDHV